MDGDARDQDGLPTFDRPTPARIYDYYLNGKDNFEVDRVAAKSLDALIGDHPRMACWENRKFLWRAVEYVAGECGISQFIDVGSGLPTARNTHEIAQEADPDARVVYVDNDPIVLSHGRALLTKVGHATVVTADARDPAGILDAPQTRAMIDFSKPVAVMFVGMLYFVPSEGHPRHVPGDPGPAEIVAAFRDRVAPGSYLVLSHATADETPPGTADEIVERYSVATSPMIFRSRAEITDLFTGWDLVEPGLVQPWQWHSAPDESPRTHYFLAGVARKP